MASGEAACIETVVTIDELFLGDGLDAPSAAIALVSCPPSPPSQAAGPFGRADGGGGYSNGIP